MYCKLYKTGDVYELFISMRASSATTLNADDNVLLNGTEAFTALLINNWKYKYMWCMSGIYSRGWRQLNGYIYRSEGSLAYSLIGVINTGADMSLSAGSNMWDLHFTWQV